MIKHTTDALHCTLWIERTVITLSRLIYKPYNTLGNSDLKLKLIPTNIINARDNVTTYLLVSLVE